jgi:hypothetical protein
MHNKKTLKKSGQEFKIGLGQTKRSVICWIAAVSDERK